jgi:D-alanine-D-alanine ligase
MKVAVLMGGRSSEREISLRTGRGAAREDFRLPPPGEPSRLEVNTIPGMTPTSLVRMAAKAAGMTCAGVVASALELALGRARV